MPDQYAPCPCGSGKKFKWCCQPFYGQIERAFEMQANGQREAALKLMSDLVAQNPTNAEVLGRQAELLWENEQREAAEQTLAKALEIKPDYTFGLYLRGMLRHEEKEIVGALSLYRQAAEACDPNARDLLAEIHTSIGQCELMLNRPLAAKAAWDIARHLNPGSEAVQQYLQNYFREDAPLGERRLPFLSLQEFAFQPVASAAPIPRRDNWKRALGSAASGRLSDALRAFERLTAEDENDLAAWYNLGLVRAWLGDNAGAVEAISEYVEREEDEVRAGDAWAITELLKFGHGMEDRCDYQEHRAIYRIMDIERAAGALNRDRRLIGMQRLENAIGGMLLDRPVAPAHENLALFELSHTVAALAIFDRTLILNSADEALLEKACQIVQEMAGESIDGPQFHSSTLPFNQVALSAITLRLPEGLSRERIKELIEQYYQQFFEEQWTHRPRKSLGLNTPIDAAEHRVLRRKLLGVIRFLEDAFLTFAPPVYDFDRLRGRLGLPLRRPQPAMDAPDILSMSAAQLAALDLAALSDEDLHRAFQSSLRLDAPELAGKFGRQLIERPIPTAESGKEWTGRAPAADRYPVFQHLISLAIQAENWAEAMSLVDAGLKHDCEQNAGKRRNDYEIKRAQVHLRAGEADAAREVFARLIDRAPTNLDVLGRAAEAMLSAQQLQQAAVFASQGYAQANQTGDRDQAQYFQELLAAARA